MGTILKLISKKKKKNLVKRKLQGNPHRPQPKGSSRGPAWYIFAPSNQARTIYLGAATGFLVKEIFSDSDNTFLWHKSKDINKKDYFQNFRQF